MPMNYNSCHIEGRLTKRGELRFTKGGTAVYDGSIGYNSRRQNKTTKEWEDAETQWYDIKAWGREAELICQLPHGTLIGIHGRMEKRYWEGVEGKRNEKFEIVIDRVYMPIITDKVFSVGPDGALFRTGRSREQAKATGAERLVYDDEQPFVFESSIGEEVYRPGTRRYHE